MKPISKILILFFGVAALMVSSTMAQRADGWVQENWQRVSGEVDKFQGQFPGQTQATSHTPGVTGGSPVRHADHQTAMPVHDIATAGAANLIEEGSGTPGNSAAWQEEIKGQLQDVNWPKVLGSLAMVVGGYLGFVWLMRKTNPKSNAGLPSEVFELIGTTRLNAKQTLQLVRLGSKLLLLVHGEEGTHPIGEITDPEEVEYLTDVCNTRLSRSRPTARPNRSSRGSAGFRTALSRANQEGETTEAAMDKVIRKLSELAGKSSRTDYEA